MASKAPKRITPARLRNVAIAYLRRYGGSSARLRQVLERRAERSLYFHGEQARASEVAGWIEAVIAELRESGTSDDAREARRRAAQGHLDGKSRRVIASQLRQKGFDAAIVDGALNALRGEEGESDADWVACCRLARRRGLGPFRRAGSEPRPLDKQLAILMRAGFPYTMARRVLESEDVESLEAAIDAYRVHARL